MGRPRNESKKLKILASIEAHYRSFFEGLGLKGDVLKQGMDYVMNHGFTMQAAARLALAGGNHRALLEKNA